MFPQEHFLAFCMAKRSCISEEVFVQEHDVGFANPGSTERRGVTQLTNRRSVPAGTLCSGWRAGVLVVRIVDSVEVFLQEHCGKLT
jgi:hypothetical protein